MDKRAVMSSKHDIRTQGYLHIFISVLCELNPEFSNVPNSTFFNTFLKDLHFDFTENEWSDILKIHSASLFIRYSIKLVIKFYLVDFTLALVIRLLRLRRVEDSIWRASFELLLFLLQLMVTEKQREIYGMEQQ